MGGWGIGEGVGWEERGFKPNGTATEHREGGGPFGLKSLYICEAPSDRRKLPSHAHFHSPTTMPEYLMSAAYCHLQNTGYEWRLSGAI
jgi:hypothetical protein